MTKDPVLTLRRMARLDRDLRPAETDAAVDRIMASMSSERRWMIRWMFGQG